MADVNARIGIDVDATAALAQIKQLQRQISLFHTNMAKGGAAASAEAGNLQRNLLNSINATGQFSASMTRIKSSAESFTNALEKNKLSMGQYFRYAGASTKTFGRLFTSEFNTINKVARERVKDLQTQYIKMGRDANGAMQAIKVRPLTLDLKNLGTQTAIAAQKQMLFNQLIKQGSTNLLNWGKNTQWAGRQLMVGFTIPLTIFGATAAREFMKLEEQAIRFKRVYGDMFTADAEVEKALSDVKKLAKEFTKFGVAIEDTVDLAASVAQMGAMGADLTNQVTEATRLAVLGGISQQEALDTTISLTNAFGLATEELTGKIAFLNAAENQTILSIEDFNEAIPKAGSVVRQLGGDVEDLAYFLTAMREGGVNASQAANALKSSLARLINPTEVAREKLAGFGIDILGIVNDNAGDLKSTIQVLAVELDKLDPLDKARAIEQLFGKFQFARMSTLFENIVKDGSQANKVLELTTFNARELGVIADRELARVSDSPLYKFKKALEEFQAALAPVGEAFLKLATPIIEFGTRLLDKFNEMGEGAKMFFVGLAAVAGVVAPAALMLIGLLANGLANLLMFGQKVSGVFSKTQGASNLLTEQLNYMNSEQLEAAAVSASLDQSHQRLIQTFTSEAGSVNALTAAYNRAILSQQQFLAARGMAPTGGATTGGGRGGAGTSKYNPFMPPKYADGILSVPGPKGAGDVVAAMLSPGEAVVPADMAQKYAPFINSIIADKVPGFESGLPTPVAFRGRSNLMHQQSGTALGLDEASKISGPVGEAATGFKLLAETTKNLAVKMEMESKEFNLKSLWGMQGDEALNQQSQQGSMLDDLRTDMDSRSSSEIWSEGVQGGGVKPEEALDDMEEYNAEYRRQIDMANEGQAKYFTDTEANLEKARVRLGDQFKPEEWTSQESLDRDTAAAVAERNPQNKVVGARKKARRSFREARTYTPSKEAWEEGLASDDPRISEPMRKKFSQQDRQTGKLKRRSGSFNLSKRAKKDAEAYNDGLEAAVEDPKDVASRLAGRNSPHPEAYPDGADDAKAYIDGQKSVLKPGSDPYKSRTPGLTPPPPPPPSVAPKRGFVGRVADRAADSRVGKAAGRGLARMSGVAVTDSKGQVYYDPNQDMSTEFGRMTAKDKEFNDNLPGGKAYEAKREKLLREEALLVKKQGQVAQSQLDSANKLADSSNQLVDSSNQLDGSARDLSNAAQKDMYDADGNMIVAGGGDGKKKKRGKGGMGRAAGLSMGLSAITMGAGMAPGAIGQQAQKLMPALMGLSMAPMLFQALQSPLMAVLAVVAAVAGSLFMLNQKFKESQKEAYELEKSLGAGKDAMRSLSEFAGSVSAGEYMDSMREDRLKGLERAPGKTTFGESFVKDESGQALIEASKMRIAQTGGNQAVISDLTNQLATAVISGVLTKEQASSMAANLGFALNDMEIGLQVRANIASLVGPNGEDISGGQIVEMHAELTRESLDQVEAQSQMMAKNLDGVWGDTFGEQVLSVAGGAGVGAGIGAAIGSLIVPGIGTAIGAAIGGIGGAIGGYFSTKDAAEKAGKLSGAVVGSITNALEQQQELSDTLDMYYDKKIQEAKVQGDITEQLRLQAEYEEKKVELSESEMQMRDQLKGQLQGPGADAARLGIDAAIETRFKDDAGAQLLLPGIKATMDTLNMSDADKDMINLELATGSLDPAAVNSLLTFIGDDEGQKDALLNVIGKFGGVFAQEASQVMSLIDDEDLSSDIFVKISNAGNEQEAQEIMDFVREIQKQDSVFDTDIILNYLNQNPEVAQELQDIFDRVDLGVTTATAAYDINPVLNDPAAFDEEYFNMLEPGDKEQYVKTVSMILAMDEAELKASPDFTRWLGDEGAVFGAYPGNNSISWWQKRYAEDMGVKVTKEMSSVDNTTAAEPPTPTGSGAKETSFLDGINKRLRDVRANQILISEGYENQAKQLEDLFGGENDLSVFSGLQQDMRSLGAGEDLIDMIAGMPAEEFEKRKGELFNFDESGDITGFTGRLQAIGKAMRAIALGDFQSQQQKSIRTVNDQVTAIRKLTAAGMGTAAAYEAVKDSAFAAAIAQQDNIDVIKELVQITEQAKEMTEGFAAAQAVAAQNQQTRDLRNSLNYVQKNQEKLTDAQKKAILSDPNLQSLIGSNIDPKVLQEALRNAEKQADLDLRIKKLTFEGRLEIFEEGFSKAMESFTVLEQEIELQFKVKKDPLLEAIKEAEEDISDIRNKAGGLDDLEADLQRISLEEDKINEKYDERVEALDRIEKATNAVNQIQKSQLDIADALSRGDIAAAARAAQEARKKQAEQAIKDRKELLDLSRQRELGRVTGKMGRTREQIEESIKDLKQQIFDIEENTIEPAQRQLELIEREQEVLVDNLEVLGKSKEEWEAIKNGIDLAKISSDKYVQAIQNALDIVDEITDYWDDLDGRVIKTTHEIKQVTVRSFSGPTSNGNGNGNGNGDKASDQDLRDALGAKPDESVIVVGGVPRVVGPSSGSRDSFSNPQDVVPRSSGLGGYTPGERVSISGSGWNPYNISSGGIVRYANGGMIIPKRMASGGFNMGSDIVPAMLTPGEFVIRRPAVRNFGVDNLEKINNGADTLGSVYNYNLNVNVKSDSDPNKIARTVMTSIKQVESKRIRGNRF